MRQPDDGGAIQRWMEGVSKRLFALENPAIRPVHQTLVFDWFGAVVSATPKSCRQIIFDDGFRILKVCAALNVPNATTWSFIVTKFAADDPGTPILAGAFTVAAGDYKESFPVDWSVDADDTFVVEVFDAGGGMQDLSIILQVG